MAAFTRNLGENARSVDLRRSQKNTLYRWWVLKVGVQGGMKKKNFMRSMRNSK
jgi:hypothetical protein